MILYLKLSFLQNSAIPYLFDAYQPVDTLSALTAAASFRLVLAAVLPLVIIQSQ